jgi:hypothetical protein
VTGLPQRFRQVITSDFVIFDNQDMHGLVS